MRELTLKRRYGGMTAIEVMLARHYKDMSLALLIVFALEDERGQGQPAWVQMTRDDSLLFGRYHWPMKSDKFG